MILASWNVNSIGVRLPLVIDWLKETKVDVLCIQETKCVDEKFPKDDFLAIGYQSAYFGQKTYNGVAIVSRSEITAVETNFPGIPNPEQARFVKAEIESVTILNSYIPNGSEPGSDKFEYKMAFLNALSQHLSDRYSKDSRLLLCGDFNIAPLDLDVYDPDKTKGQILVSDEERAALAKLKDWGFVDGFRKHVEEGGHYTWWDYRQMAFRRKMGYRIDHVWLSEGLAPACVGSWIDISPRKKERPSDHTPILVELKV